MILIRKTLHEIKEFSKKQNLDTVLDDLDQNQIKEILKEASFGKNAWKLSNNSAKIICISF